MSHSSKLVRRSMAVLALGLCVSIVWLFLPARKPDLVIGAKAFTESRVLAEAIGLLCRETGRRVEVRELGGTQVLWSALRSGEIAAYVDYTGTLRREMYGDEALPDEEALRTRLSKDGVSATQFLGFDNSFRLGMKRERAEELGIRSAADLAAHTDLKYGFGPEFLERADGWPGLRDHYQLQGSVIGLEHQLAYQALDAGDLDVVDVYTTDSAVRTHDLTVLSDDFFPRYDALLLYRSELDSEMPDIVEQLRRMGGSLDNESMLALNEAVEAEKKSELRVARGFVANTFQVNPEIGDSTLTQRVARTTRGHLKLVIASLLAAIVVAVPAGVVAAKKPWLGHVIVTLAEVVQTIPGLALLVFLSAGLQAISMPSLGALPVTIALFLYSLLPILRNTMAGIQGVPRDLRESAQALGLTARDQLLLIELPLAARTILAGVKTTAVINVGYATLGGLIGAVCYGEPIMTGLRSSKPDVMLEGAIPAAIMALGVKWVFEFVERQLALES